jgi:hypothetical protein
MLKNDRRVRLLLCGCEPAASADNAAEELSQERAPVTGFLTETKKVQCEHQAQDVDGGRDSQAR